VHQGFAARGLARRPAHAAHGRGAGDETVTDSVTLVDLEGDGV
jgi:hypothetical protein